MREYTVTFKEGLTAGLRASSSVQRKLVQADGVLRKSEELINLDELSTFDISSIEACTHPFPQIFQLRNWTLICTPTKIYTFDGTTLTLVYTAAEGSTWTIADFYRFLVLTNGNEYITLDPETGAWSKYLDAVISECLCVCDVNGQLFAGGPEVSVGAGFLGV